MNTVTTGVSESNKSHQIIMESNASQSRSIISGHEGPEATSQNGIMQIVTPAPQAIDVHLKNQKLEFPWIEIPLRAQMPHVFEKSKVALMCLVSPKVDFCYF